MSPRRAVLLLLPVLLVLASSAAGAHWGAPMAALATTPTPIPTPDVKEPPREFAFQEDFFLKDRIVLDVAGDTAEVGLVEGTTHVIYARTPDAPFDALYVPVSQNPADGYIRYLPEHLDRPEVPCPAEGQAMFPTLGNEAEGVYYVFGGTELDLGTDLLTPDTNPGMWQDPVKVDGKVREFYVEGPAGLERMILVPVDGVPELLAAPLPFAGDTFTFTESLSKDEAPVRKRVGCAGPFRAGAVIGEDQQPFRRIYVDVGENVLVYNATDAGSTDGADEQETPVVCSRGDCATAAEGSSVPAGSPAAGCPALGPEWEPVLRWRPEVVAAQQQVAEDLQERGLEPVMVPVNVVLAVIMIESQGIMPDGANQGGAVGLLQVPPTAIGADRYDFDRAATDPAYSLSIGVNELALRYLDSGKLPWRNVVVGYFAGHYEPTGTRDAYSSDYAYQARFDEYFAQLEGAATCDDGAAIGSPVAAGNWLAGQGQPIDGLAYLWGGLDAPLTQEFGPTAFSRANPEFFAYSLEYGFPEPAHTGLDVGIVAGTPLYAPSEAVVVCAGTGNGNGEDSCAAFAAATGGPTSGRLQLRLPNGDMLIYGHVSWSIVRPGRSSRRANWSATPGARTATSSTSSTVSPTRPPRRGGASSIPGSLRSTAWRSRPAGTGDAGATSTPAGGSIVVYLRDRHDQEIGGGCVELRGNQRFSACDDDDNDADKQPGIIRFDGVPFGGYVVLVNPAPPGYERPRSKSATLSPDNSPLRVPFRLVAADTPPPATQEPTEGPLPGSLAIATVDAADGAKLLPGACFVVTTADGPAPEACDDDGDGLTRFEGLMPGDATIHQTRPPDGYSAGPDQTVTIPAGGGASVTVPNEAIAAGTARSAAG